MSTTINVLAVLLIASLLLLTWLGVGERRPAPAPVVRHRLGVVDSVWLGVALALARVAPHHTAPAAVQPEEEAGESTQDDVEPTDPEGPPAAPEQTAPAPRVPAAVSSALKLGPDWPVPVDLTVPPVPQDAQVFQALASTSYAAALDVKGPAVPDWPTGSWAVLNTTGSRT